MTERRKRVAIAFAGIALVAMLLLSAAFHTTELSPVWHPLPPAQQAAPAAPAGPEPEQIEIPAYLYAALLILSLALVVAIVVAGLVSRKTRKHTARNLVLVLALTAILMALNSPPDTLVPVTPEPTRALPFEDLAVPVGAEGTPMPNLDLAAAQRPWMAWGIAVALALLVAAGLVAATWFFWRYTHPPASPLEQFAQEAQAAIDALRAGADPTDTILRCYLEMSRVLRTERGITRNQAMTPREFETSLEQVGLPDEQIRQLTRLFETARYGARHPGHDEGRQAIDCLTAIVRACQATP